jgi:uncharacterized protein YjiS (DUF1127 family)
MNLTQRVGHDWLALFSLWHRRAHDRSMLMAMSDRNLQDIGITRWDARREARKPFWRA